jgi:hypothetical protein
MSLIRTTRRSGLTLIVLGVLGAGFFLLTDPRTGPRDGERPAAYDPRAWAAAVQGAHANPVDAGSDASPATLLGLVGCLTVLGVGVFLASRRKV